jgi:hypothetical protein
MVGKTNNEGTCHEIKDSAMKGNRRECVESLTDSQECDRLPAVHVHHVNVEKNSEILTLRIYFL